MKELVRVEQSIPFRGRINTLGCVILFKKIKIYNQHYYAIFVTNRSFILLL